MFVCLPRNLSSLHRTLDLFSIPTCGLGHAGTVGHRCGDPGDVVCGVGRLVDEDHH